MQKTSLFALALALTIAFQPAAAQPNGTPRTDTRPAFLQQLRVGQAIPLKPGGMLWEIEILNDGSIGTHLLVEVAAQHIVVQDISGRTRSWIPATAIKSVAWVRVNGATPSVKMPPPVGPWPAPNPGK